MKVINCNVLGTPTDTPSFSDDRGYQVLGVFDSSSRVSFELNDNITGGGHIYWNNSSVNFLVPEKPGSYEGSDLGIPTLSYIVVSTLLPLHTEGRRIVNSAGQDVIIAGATHFLHFQRYLEWKLGHGDEPCDYAGANAYRSTVLMTYLPNLIGLPALRPENYPNYWTDAPSYVDYCLAKGIYPHLLVRCDIQMSGQSPAELREIDGQWAEILRDRGLLSKGNEEFKNGWKSTDSHHPGHGVVWCSGTSAADSAPNYQPDDNVIEWEGRRDWPKVTSSSEDMWYVARDSSRPILHVETMGFGEVYQHEKRSTDPDLARQIGASIKALNGTDIETSGYVCGGAVHLQNGTFSQPLGPIQDECRKQFFIGLKGA